MPTTAFALPRTRQETPAVPPMRVVRGGRYSLRKARQAAAGVAWAAVLALVMAMVVGVLYSQAQITRLSSEIDSTRQELTNAQSTYDYLSTEMSRITSNANVQEIAEGELGLIKADNSQITYIRLQEQSTVQRATGRAALFFNSFRTAALSLLDDIAP